MLERLRGLFVSLLLAAALFATVATIRYRLLHPELSESELALCWQDILYWRD
jgi:hypothetical protein